MSKLIINLIHTPNRDDPKVHDYLQKIYPTIADDELVLNATPDRHLTKSTSNAHRYFTRIFQNKGQLNQITIQGLDVVKPMHTAELLTKQTMQNIIADILLKRTTNRVILVGNDQSYQDFFNEILQTGVNHQDWEIESKQTLHQQKSAGFDELEITLNYL